MDPITLALMAFSAVKQGVAIYKEVAGTAHEVHNIVTDLGKNIGSFFDHQEKAIEAQKEVERNPPKDKSISAIALDNVIARKRLEQAEVELRELLIYQAPPELGAVWEAFQIERDKLRKERDMKEAAEKKS